MKNKIISKSPGLISFIKIGQPDIGYISVAENEKLPFIPVRYFWTYFTPESILRGRHAHYKTEQIIIAASGRIIVNVEFNKEKSVYVLENPYTGIYIPPLCWHTMQYSHNAVQVVLASTCYDESDYIRNYEDYKRLCQ